MIEKTQLTRSLSLRGPVFFGIFNDAMMEKMLRAKLSVNLILGGRVMSVNQEVSKDGKKVHINITGRFDYKVSQAFRDSYRRIPGQECVSYYVDLSAAVYMDSSALGMLLLLREHAKCHGGSVFIERPSKQVDDILKVANFEQLFTINHTCSVSPYAVESAGGEH